MEEIAAHIAEARADLRDDSEAEVRTLLDRVGDPADIAADARERFGVQPRRGGAREIAAIVLLLVGGFIALVGWLVGVVLLWASDVWSTRDKLIGTFVVPGGLALPLTLLVIAGSSSGESCVVISDGAGNALKRTCAGGTSGFHEALVVILVIALLLAPVVTSVYLARRMRRPIPAA